MRLPTRRKNITVLEIIIFYIVFVKTLEELLTTAADGILRLKKKNQRKGLTIHKKCHLIFSGKKASHFCELFASVNCLLADNSQEMPSLLSSGKKKKN